MSAPLFAGREFELKSLRSLVKKKVSSLVVIRGRRRIGKSRLIEEFAKKYRFLRFSGLPPTESTTAESQRAEFAKQMSEELGAPMLDASDWSNLFSFLARETSKGRIVILFDEISWMGNKDADFLGKLKNTWDILFKKNPELILILCSSVSVWIDENILKSTGFVGRISLTLDLDELSLSESNLLLDEVGFRGSAYEKFKILSVTGGVPRYLEEIKPDQPAEENIKNLCFQKSGILFREFKDIFTDIFSRRSMLYKKITETLVNGPKELSAISTALGLQKSGHLSEYLNNLVISGFISRDFTWSVKDAKEARLSHYRLSDNYLRFYLKYIGPYQGRIEKNHFTNKSLTTLPGFESIIGLQFENLVLKNRAFIWKKLNLYPENIISDNPYFQRAQVRAKGCQVDYLIQTNTNVLYACEIKFSNQEIKPGVIKEIQQKFNHLTRPKGFSLMPVLIHVNGASNAVVESEYFYQIIDFGELLNVD